MANSGVSLKEAIQEHIRKRIYIVIFSIVGILFFTIGAYILFFVDQTEKKMNQVATELTPYIASQSMLSGDESEKAIHMRIDRESLMNHVKIVWRKGEVPPKIGFHTNNILYWSKYVPILSLDDKPLGYYIISGSLLDEDLVVFWSASLVLMSLIFSFIVWWLLVPIATGIPEKLFLKPINRLIDLLDSGVWRIKDLDAPLEIVKIGEHVLKSKEEQEEAFRKNELLKLAQQVAHDIRSPLQAIITAVKIHKKLPEDLRVTLATASGRINDIANNLLTHNQSYNHQMDSPSSKETTEMVFFLLDSLLSEKRYEYAESNVSINFVHENIGQAVAIIDPSQFKRSISNLINNSAESTAKEVTITVSLDIHDDYIEVKVDDNGSGVSKEDIEKIKEEGVSLAKKGGAGLGLSQAYKYISSIGGTLQIHSELGKGTTVTIKIPRSIAPAWFSEVLDIKRDDIIVIVDDDQSIHDSWRYRFEDCLNNKVIDIYSPRKLKSFLTSNDKTGKCFLVDYEFLGNMQNGIDLIKKHKLKGQAYLVTSNIENESIRTECESLGLTIIPKPYVPYIPIIFKSEKTAQSVLIEDNEMLRKGWMSAAKAAGKYLICFSSIAECEKRLAELPPDTTFYIDSDLGEGIRGEDFAKVLFDKGYRELYLTTGMPAQKFEHCFWLRAVLTKEPPFEGEV